MRRIPGLVFVGLLSIASGQLAAAAAPPSESIAIETTDNSYVLTVPVSRLTMSIPRGELTLKGNSANGSAGSPRYFHFEDSAHHLIVSGWFEAAQGFRGIESFWASETNAWKQNGLPEVQNVSFVKVGTWDAVLYDVTYAPVTSSHIRAHWVQAGTWIDIHLSVTSDRTSAENREVLELLLQAIVVKERLGVND